MHGLRLLMVTQDYPPAVGGIQTYANALARQLAPRCEAFCVLAPAQPGAADFDADQPFATVRQRTSSDWMRLRVLPILLRVAKERKLDVVLTGHWYVAAAALAARRMGAIKRVYVAAHGQELVKSLLPFPLAPLYAAHRRQVLRTVDGVFPVSHYTAGLLERDGVPPPRIHVVGNGTDLSRFDTAQADQQVPALRARFGLRPGPVLLTLARLVPRKGIDTVIQALPELVRRHPDTQYVIAGAGPDRARLEALAASRGVAERCHFVGRVAEAELPAVYRLCDVFVMPARAVGPSVEGFGLSFCEAGACERPVIGSTSGGIPDAVVDGETGLLVQPDAPGELTRALDRLLSDRVLAASLGRQGRERIAREGTWDHTATAIHRHMLAG